MDFARRGGMHVSFAALKMTLGGVLRILRDIGFEIRRMKKWCGC
jgi:hypothetical protein